jgi:hypothetical protein
MVDLDASSKRIAALQEAKTRAERDADDAVEQRDRFKAELEEVNARHVGRLKGDDKLLECVMIALLLLMLMMYLARGSWWWWWWFRRRIR